MGASRIGAAITATTILAASGGASANESIEVRLFHGYASIRSERVVHVAGVKSWSMEVDDFPDGAVATGLRARFGDASDWTTARLVPTDVDPFRKKGARDPYALLSWTSPSALALEVFSPNRDDVIETTYLAPTDWIDGRDTIVLPRAEGAVAIARVGDGRDRLFVDGAPATNAPFSLGDADVTLSLARADAKPFDGTLARVPIAGKRAIVSLRLEVAKPLSIIPTNVHVAVAIDGSRSMGAATIDANRAAASAYLESFRAVAGARAEVLVFDRWTHRRTNGFVAIEEAIRALDAPIDPANGSAIDDVIATTKSDFAALPEATPKRILLFSDLSTRDGLDLATVARDLKANRAVAHVVESILSNETSIVRIDDGSTWSEMARATGGLLWTAWLADGDRAKAIDVLGEWARPRRIDVIAGTDVIHLPWSLDEGSGFAETTITENVTAKATIEGEIWSTKVKLDLDANLADEDRAAALAIPEVYASLSGDELRRLATRAGVVSSETSFLALDRGAHLPTLDPDDLDGIGLQGFGSGCSCSCGGGCGGTGSIGWHAPPSLQFAFKEAAHACGVAHAQLDVETNYTEIVDVSVTTEDAARRSCLEDAIWSLRLPSGYERVVRSSARLLL